MAAPEHDWYLHAWCSTLGKIQNDLHTELHMHKNTMNRLWKGDQPYRRDYVNQISTWLNIQPYELLMHPKDAMALREYRKSALQVVESTAISQTPTEAVAPPAPAEAPRRRKA